MERPLAMWTMTGDLDVLVVNNNGPARLLINNVGQRQHWIGLRLLGKTTKRDMLGTRVLLLRPDGPALWRRSRTDGSYGSANDPRVLFGLGKTAAISAVRVHWPSGRVEEWTETSIDGYTTLREGGGKTLTPP